MTTPSVNQEETAAVVEIVGPDGSKLPTSSQVAMRRPLDTGMSLTAAEKASPMALIETALRLGASLEQTRELIALHRDVEKHEARKLFFKALAAFQMECPPIAKTKTADITSERSGTSYAYTWAPLDEIDRTIRPIMAKYGLSYTWDQVQEGTSCVVICVVRHEAGHEERTSVKLNVGGSPGMSEQQKVASTMKNGKRFSLESALGLSTTDDIPDVEDNQEKITEDQAVVIGDLLREAKTPPSRFFKHFGVKSEKVEDLKAIDYNAAVAILEEKVKK